MCMSDKTCVTNKKVEQFYAHYDSLGSIVWKPIFHLTKKLFLMFKHLYVDDKTI